MKKINSGVWAGVILLIFSLVFLLNSFDLAYISDIGPGPGFFPVWLSGILSILSLLYIVVSFKNKDSEDSEEERLPKGEALKNILLILISMTLFTILLPILGFIMSSTIFLFTLLFSGYRWFVNLAISFGVSIILYGLFDRLLDVQLPVSAFGF
ncbi:tripartite tricarboxylate transporter TctB family protein [Neobacillus niacini]|uniref:tripartite tricarboxylate transporter TctB family protein n=1 Tax=Neobacillus niacini TaxID=86668 RepID=UPI0007AC1336|nr:tripartite tricarboxylate transporter TctB family protein [Neobacillus niacini]MEC1523861.1 tripartite tricarboxylate transporter TctB family protein [Neobacillus niacini]